MILESRTCVRTGVPRRRWSWRALSLATVVNVVLWTGALARAEVVAQYDFENGTQGWSGFFGATVAVSGAAAQAGNQSLLATTNSSGTGGPSIAATSSLLPGATYSILGWVRLTSGEAATSANFTVARTDPTCSGGTCFDTVGTFMVPVNDAGWAEIGGNYQVSATATALLLYAQLVGPTSTQTFYLDSVVVTQTVPPPGGPPLATYTFQDGGLDGWQPFGSVTLSNAVSPVPDPAGNSRSLLTSNRTATFMGPSLDLLGVSGVAARGIYAVTAYLLLAAPDSSNPTVTLAAKRVDCGNPSGIFANLVTSGPLSSTAWTRVQGTLSFDDIPGPPTSLTLYFQSSSASDAFYISDVVIGALAPPPPPPDQQDNAGITSTFEDSGLEGWSSRSGASSVTNSTAAAHSGAHSLLTTGRTGNFDGPQINVSNKLYAGSQYAISVWVMLVPTDGSSHVINMSLQTTFLGTTSFPSVTGFPGVAVVADGNWHQISVPRFDMTNRYDPGAAFLFLQTFPASGTDLVSFYIDDFQVTFLPPPTIQTNIPSIFQSLQSFFPVGGEVDTSDVSGPHEQLLVKHFNSLTSGNDMKWSSVENIKGTFNYANADAEVAVAVCNDMKVRGHNLVWANGSQTPSYVFGDGSNSPANQAVVIANIQEHIQNEVTHFGSKVYAWDVVNEPIDANQPDCLVHGPFYGVLGPSYLDVALRAARQYAPTGTKLFINEFGTTDPARLSCLVSLVRSLRSRHVPIDAVGHEMHNNINFPSVSAMENAIRVVGALGVDQQITELDLSVYNAGDNSSNYGANGGTVPASILAQQGYLYWQYFNLFRRLHNKISGVTFWGIADDDTWLDSFPISRLDMPLPFDTALQAKPAYYGIIDEPTMLPGFNLSFDIPSKSGPRTANAWTVRALDGGPGTAYTVTITGFTLASSDPRRPCTPTITPAPPVSLGDVPEGGSASTPFTINFAGCSGFVSGTLSWSAANGAYTGKLLVTSQVP